jgi:hypothetical protein
MYAPIRPSELLMGYFGAYATVGAILVIASAGTTGAASIFLGLQPGTAFWWSLLAAAISISEAGAIGLLISAVSGQMRAAVFLLLGLVLVLAGTRVAADALVPLASPNSWAHYVSLLLASPSQVIRALSPLDLYAGAMDAGGAGQYTFFGGWLALGLLRAGLWMFLATRVFVWVGVRP